MVTFVTVSASLLYTEWPDDGSLSLFHPDTGETHLLNPFAAECLTFLREHGPASAETCVRHMQALIGETASDISAQVADTFKQFKELELVYDNREWSTPAPNAGDALPRRL